MIKIIMFLVVLFSLPLYKTEAYQFCGYGQIYDFATDSCKCSYGFRENNGMCISNDQYCKNKYGTMSNSDIKGDCTCAYGYGFKENQCVPLDSYCKDIFGSASYYSLSGECECQSGYILDGGKCTSAILYCSKNYGSQSVYNPLSKECECGLGYTFNNNGSQCISLNEKCVEDFGINSYAPIQSHTGNMPVTCQCKSGSIWNKDQTTCIDANKFCRNQIGINSEYDATAEECKCLEGYVLENNSCETEQNFCKTKYGENYEYEGNSTCGCAEGYEEIDGECKEKEYFYNFYKSQSKVINNTNESGKDGSEYTIEIKILKYFVVLSIIGILISIIFHKSNYFLKKMVSTKSKLKK